MLTRKNLILVTCIIVLLTISGAAWGDTVTGNLETELRLSDSAPPSRVPPTSERRGGKKS